MENQIYESTVLVNPKWFLGFRKNKPVKLSVKDNQLILGTLPPTVIPFQNIKSIKYNYWFDSAFKINLIDGRTYRIVWFSDDKTIRYSAMETGDVFNNLKRIIK